jgi:hypothetical protein
MHFCFIHLNSDTCDGYDANPSSSMQYVLCSKRLKMILEHRAVQLVYTLCGCECRRENTNHVASQHIYNCSGFKPK